MINATRVAYCLLRSPTTIATSLSRAFFDTTTPKTPKKERKDEDYIPLTNAFDKKVPTCKYLKISDAKKKETAPQATSSSSSK